ncbi:MAG: GNAT family N-acetyltransferase [Parcubacteria group bacterium]
MKLVRIHSPRTKTFSKVWYIFRTSFWPDERRTRRQESKLLTNSHYRLWAVWDQKELVGTVTVWDLKKWYFIEHLAVKRSRRDRGYGSKIMHRVMTRTNRPWVLEVGRSKDLNNKRRIEFYRRLRFKVNRHTYVQPPYDKNKKFLKLYLMTYPKKITKGRYLRLNRRIKSIVYHDVLHAEK